MGGTNSKNSDEEVGLPARYARGCSSSELKYYRMTHASNSIVESLIDKGTNKNSKCILIYGQGNKNESIKSTNTCRRKNIFTSPRLQGQGLKERSYLEQLVELRKQKSGSLSVSNCGDSRSSNVSQPEHRKELNKCNTTDIIDIISNFTHTTTDEDYSSDGEAAETKHLSNEVSSASQEVPTYWATRMSWGRSRSKDSAMVADGLEQYRSDLTIVPYSQAKARFESGVRRSKAAAKKEDFLQLEKLGLGLWKNDQWVPNKIVALAISDELSSSSFIGCDSRSSFPKSDDSANSRLSGDQH